MAQDSGFSFPQQRFETAWGYKKNSTQVGFFFYTLEQTASQGIKKINRKVGLFLTAQSGIKKAHRKMSLFFNLLKGYKKSSTQVGFFTGYKKDQPQGWSGGIRKRTGNQADPFSYAKALVPNLQNGKSPSIGGRQYFTSWNERLLNKLQIHQNRIHGSLLCCLFLLKAK